MRNWLTGYIHSWCLQLSKMREVLFLINNIVIYVTTSSTSADTYGIICKSRMGDSIAFCWDLNCSIFFALCIIVINRFLILIITMGRFQGWSDSFLTEDWLFIIILLWNRDCSCCIVIRLILKNWWLWILTCFESF